MTSLKLEKGKERSKLENFVLMFTVQITGKGNTHKRETRKFVGTHTLVFAPPV